MAPYQVNKCWTIASGRFSKEIAIVNEIKKKWVCRYLCLSRDIFMFVGVFVGVYVGVYMLIKRIYQMGIVYEYLVNQQYLSKANIQIR